MVEARGFVADVAKRFFVNLLFGLEGVGEIFIVNIVDNFIWVFKCITSIITFWIIIVFIGTELKVSLGLYFGQPCNIMVHHDTCTFCSLVKIDVKIVEDGGQTIIMRNVRNPFSSRFKEKFLTLIPLKGSNISFLRHWFLGACYYQNRSILNCLLNIILSCHFRPAQMLQGKSQPRSTLSSCDQTRKYLLLHLLHSFWQMFLLDMTACFYIAWVENPNLKFIDDVICFHFPVWFWKIYLILLLSVKLSFEQTHVILCIHYGITQHHTKLWECWNSWNPEPSYA